MAAPDSPHGFAELDPLLDAALDRPQPERARFIAEICGSDTALRARLEQLVALAEGGPDVLAPSGGLRGALWEDLARDLDGGLPELQPGTTLGRYQVRGLLGTGGMGRVYRAFDPTLAREVAIKALARSWSDGGAEARARFEREGRVLANLNHPNIGAIYGFELIDGALYLVLELVEGQTLAERLQRGALALDEALPVALQVALALEEAHRKGVVHRDLKPGNVKLDPQGRVKVLDFGIAKTVVSEPLDKATPKAIATTTGALLGTAPYMSPEQLRGEPVDPRTDVWAFGCLVYEMLVGRPAFHAASPSEVVASVLRDDVEWSRLPAATPAALRRLLRRCLRRDLKQRLQDIGDARLELAELGRTDDDDSPVPANRRRLVPWLVAVAVLLPIGAFFAGRAGEHGVKQGVARLGLELKADVAIAQAFATPFALSPDGARVVVVGTKDGDTRLLLRELDKLDAVPIPGSAGGWQPFFSADGRELAFFAERKLKRVALGGGPVLPVAEIGKNPRGGTWAADGTIVLSPSARSGLVRVAPGSSVLTPLTRLDLARGEGSHRWPQALPGSPWVLFTTSIGDTIFDDARVEAVSLATGERRVLIGLGCHGRYAAGRLFFTRAGRLFAVAFDPRDLAVRGTPSVVVEGVRYDPRSGATDVALAENGTLVYTPAPPVSSESYLAWADAEGRLVRIGDAAREFREPCLSPDGRRIAARIGSETDSELWVIDTESATSTRLPFGGSVHRPVWSADGRGITVATQQDGRWKLLTLPVSGSAAPVTLYESDHRVYANAWSADGRTLVFQELRPETSWDLRALSVGADGRPLGAARDVAALPHQERNATLSPDGAWVAYEADEPDAIAALYVTSMTDPATTVHVPDTTTARWPRWDAGGRLYYWLPTGRPPENGPAAEGLQRIEWRYDGPRLVLQRTTSLWPDARGPGALPSRLNVAPYASYDVDLGPRGPRFLVLEARSPAEPAPAPRPVVVLNWFDELRSRP